MCGGGGGDGGAGEARAAEAARRDRITKSVGEVNSAFDKFNPGFYGGISKAYLDYYKPQLAEQSAEARRSLILSNPSAGSSAFARKTGMLETDIARQDSNLTGQSIDVANTQRGQIERARSGLVSQAEAVGGLEGAANQSALAADVASRPQQFSPLGQLFADNLTTYANSQRAVQQGYKPISFVPSLFSNKGGSSTTNVP